MKKAKRAIFKRSRNFQAVGVAVACLLITGLGTSALQHQATTKEEVIRAAAARRERAAAEEQRERQRLNEAQRIAGESSSDDANRGGSDNEQNPDASSNVRPSDNTKPGEMIAHDPASDVKVYWAGGFEFNPSSVTYSLTSQQAVEVTLTTVDGKTVAAPVLALDDGKTIKPTLPTGVNSNAQRSSWTFSFVLPEGVEAGVHNLYISADAPYEVGAKERYIYSSYLTVKVVQ